MKNDKPFESLTKDNFWDELFLKCPKSKDIFNKWLDNWKREHKWKTMFFVTKFHQIPVEMQYGIILQFLMEKSLCDLVIIPFVKGQKKAIPLVEYKQKLTNLFVKLEKQND
jgi:hypothetical protein